MIVRSSLASASSIRAAVASSICKTQLRRSCKSLFASSFVRHNSTSVNTAAKYAGAGILNPFQDKDGLVDVTNVLVIGSGGLSIGQAGEFDYSGTFPFFLFFLI